MKKLIYKETVVSPTGYDINVYHFFGLKFKKKILPEIKPYNDFYAENPKVYLSIVAVAKNEAPYIKEWIEYHKLVGVERFYFYDNESTDNTREVLEPYIKEGSVIYNYVEGKGIQNSVYSDAIFKYKHQTEWMAIIDLDEYIVPVEKDTIPEFLKDYEKYCGVGINWVMFDSNGHETMQDRNGGLITTSFTRVTKDYNTRENRHIKSILKPGEVISIINPHYAIYRNHKHTVSENVEKIDRFLSKYHSSNKIRINHYYTKSLEEYKKRISNGSGMKNSARRFEEDKVNFHDAVNDYAIQKYVPELERRMEVLQEENK